MTRPKHIFLRLLLVAIPVLMALAPAMAQNTVCVGQTSELSVVAVPGDTYEWELYTDPPPNFATTPGNVTTEAVFIGGNTGPMVRVQWLVPGIYFYKVTATRAGCTNNLKVGKMDIKPAPQIVTVGGGIYCEGTPVTLAARSSNGGNPEFTWMKPDGSIKYGPTLNLGPSGLDASGKYTITGIISSCSTSEVVDVVIKPNPKPKLSSVGDICSGQTVVLSTETAYSEYLWQDGSTLPDLEVATAGFYRVTVTGDYNCKASDSIMIVCGTVIREELSIWLPNAFTPDGDNVNDIFRAKSTSDNVSFTFQMLIFNKWGEQIFSSNDISEGWDGTFKGKPCPSDMYTWIVNFGAPSGYVFKQKSPQRGMVMLIK